MNVDAPCKQLHAFYNQLILLLIINCLLTTIKTQIYSIVIYPMTIDQSLKIAFVLPSVITQHKIEH